MKNIKYRYARNEQGVVVSINELTKETLNNQTYYCLECGKPLIAKLGEIRTWHFAHPNNDAQCNRESYLHKLAKHLIKKKFEQSPTFIIKFHSWCKCDNHNACPLYDFNYCRERVLNKYDLKEYYNKCLEEEVFGNFRADLLLIHSENPKREPVLIEIHVTHKSTEEKKNSGHRIIELTINSEDDIEHIINSPIIEEDSYREKRSAIFYGFKSCKTTKCYKESLPQIIKFSDNIRIKYEECYKAFTNPYKDAHIITFIGHLEKNDIEKYGYILTRKNNFEIKTCTLCKYYKDGICCLYKKFYTDKYPKHHTARICKFYRENREEIERLKKTISEYDPNRGLIDGYRYYIC